MYSTTSIAAVAMAGLLCMVIPIVAVTVFKRKNKDVPLSLFFIGAAAFAVFALVLEQLLHTVMLPIVLGKPVAYVIYGALAAGVFEETARFTVYKTFMKKSPDCRSAIMYGLGHGGFEAIIIAGFNMFSMCVFMSMINSTSLEEFAQMYSQGNEATAETVRTQMSALVGYGFANAVPVVFERCIAITLHTALSVIMFGILRGKPLCYPVCILIHTIADVPSAMYQIGKMSLGMSYVFACIVTAATVFAAVKISRKYDWNVRSD
ncbi:MAG: YhfC family intramembrane metalloprotease [Ruminococcus sp.]|nr:YhfC family intramembrane metalloprotease [Ruminococcus sp.]